MPHLPIVVYLPERNCHSGGGNLMQAVVDMLNTAAKQRVAYSVPGRVEGVDALASNKTISEHAKAFPNDAAPLELVRSGRFAALYPEVTKGNPLRAQVVIRWVLLIPPDNIHQTWRHGDIIVNFLPVYLHLYNKWWRLSPRDALAPRLSLFLAFNSYPFRDLSAGAKRKGTAFTCRKAYAAFRRDAVRQSLSPIHDLVDSFRIEPGLDLLPEQLERLFSERERFYSYDPFTFLSVIAALCGCLSIVEPIEGIPLEEYRRLGGPLVANGIAYGTTQNQLDHAQKTQPLVCAHLDRVVASNGEQLSEFVRKYLALP